MKDCSVLVHALVQAMRIHHPRDRSLSEPLVRFLLVRCDVVAAAGVWGCCWSEITSGVADADAGGVGSTAGCRGAGGVARSRAGAGAGSPGGGGGTQAPGHWFWSNIWRRWPRRMHPPW